MFGDSIFIITGLISIMWTTALIGWCARHPGERVPLILLAGPIVTGALTMAEGIGRIG